MSLTTSVETKLGDGILMIRHIWTRTKNGRRILGSCIVRDSVVVVTAEGFPGVKVRAIRRPESANALAPIMVRELGRRTRMFYRPRLVPEHILAPGLPVLRAFDDNLGPRGRRGDEQPIRVDNEQRRKGLREHAR